MTSLRPEAAPTVVAVEHAVDELLLRTLEPTMTALHRLFDAARLEASEHGQPDGFDGIDCVGAPERLLPTEWLLAAEAPDEFLRRYEHRELSYFRLNRAREQRSPTALVLFDTGPAQLGLPRVAQLACLVVLARRARDAGVDLRWGTLHDGERFSAGEPDTLDRFLAARTWRMPAGLPLDAFVDDCLVVSPLPGPPYAAQQLVLRDDGTGDAVHTTLVDRRAGTIRDAVVPMPSPVDAVRLLRSPTGTRRGATQLSGARPVSNLVFDQSGRKVLARVAPHRVAVYPAPSSAGEQPGRVRFAETAAHLGVVIAAGRVRKTVVTVQVADDGRAVFVDAVGGSRRVPTGRFPIEEGRLAVPTDDAPLGRATWADGALRVQLGDCALVPTVTGFRVAKVDAAWRWGRTGFDVSADPKGSGEWLVQYGSTSWWYRGSPVISPILRGTKDAPVMGVLVLSDDGRNLVAVRPGGGTDTVYQAGERIADVAVHPHQRRYAVRTESGRVVVGTWDPDEIVYELVPV